MTAAVQTPWAEKNGQRLGRRTFRKQVLPLGSIDYDGKTLAFTRDRLGQLAANFQRGAMDMVPFVLATDRNEHTADPERVRGEIKGLEVTDRGLDAVVELSDRGAELIGDHPGLPVSARIVPDPEKGWVLEHVCGTVNPRVSGMRPWEQLNLSRPDEGLLDLSSAPVRYETEDDTVTEFRTEAMPASETDTTLSAEDIAALKALLSSQTEPSSEEKPADEPRLSEEDANRVVEALLSDDGDAEHADSVSQEPVALTAEAREAIDLAKTQADQANEQAREMRRKFAEAEWRNERREYAEAGVPPAMLDLAKPILADPDVKPIDLSNGEQTDPAKVIRQLLDESKGRIDLTGATGSGSANDDQREQAREAAQRWAEAS